MLGRLWREPLLHFVVLGAALFVLSDGFDQPDTSADNRIEIGAGRIEHLAAGFQRTWQRPPTAEELQGLIDSHIREEIYYREALALGLDQDDALVRRRMMQKLEFLTAGVADSLVPSDQELQDYLQEHPDVFRLEPGVAFRQIYLNPDRHGEDLHGVAGALLSRLQTEDLPPTVIQDLGDATMLPSELALTRRGEIASLFGEGFADDLLGVEAGAWHGPIASAFGLHLVKIIQRQEARLPSLDEVREAVEREWRHQRRQQLTTDFYQQLRKRYTVVVETPGPGDGRPLARNP